MRYDMASSEDKDKKSLYSGLTKPQLKWAKRKAEMFETLGVAVPYGMIRKKALTV
jgi:hypothetical protein